MNLIGKRFGRWTVESTVEPYINIVNGKEYGSARYNCLCDCGNKKLVLGYSLLNGKSQSCGCLARERASSSNKTHGLSDHPLYMTWSGMNNRCYDPSHISYHNYGGRGIEICDKWLSIPDGLIKFIEDMYPSYEDGLTLDRIDVNGNYCKENCAWATPREQAINRRHTDIGVNPSFLTFEGKTMCMSQWAEEIGVGVGIIYDRLERLGWSVEKSLTTPARAKSIQFIIEECSYSMKDIFYRSVSLPRSAKRLGKTTEQFCADLFFGIATVTARIDRKTYTISPVEDLSGYIKRFKIKEPINKILENISAK